MLYFFTFPIMHDVIAREEFWVRGAVNLEFIWKLSAELFQNELKKASNVSKIVLKYQNLLN